MSIPFVELSFLIFNTIAHLNSIKHLAVLHSCFMLSCKHAITFQSVLPCILTQCGLKDALMV